LVIPTTPVQGPPFPHPPPPPPPPPPPLPTAPRLPSPGRRPNPPPTPQAACCMASLLSPDSSAHTDLAMLVCSVSLFPQLGTCPGAAERVGQDQSTFTFGRCVPTTVRCGRFRSRCGAFRAARCARRFPSLADSKCKPVSTLRSGRRAPSRWRKPRLSLWRSTSVA
jgi:hypothetical protein